jgi:hypothetical protein
MGRGRIGVCLPSPEDETNSVYKTLFFLLIRITDNGQSTEIEDSDTGSASTTRNFLSISHDGSDIYTIE